MSKRHPTEQSVQKWIERGDGQGTGVNYTPFFHPRDVPSIGRSRLFLGLFILRLFVTLSDIEYYYVLLAEYAAFAGFVVDIREQVALIPWESPQKIATQLRVRYPIYRGTTIPSVMTSDLVLSIPTRKGVRLLVLCIKPASALAHGDRTQETRRSRLMELLQIEKEFWSLCGAEWGLHTDKMLPMILVKNLDFTRHTMVGDERHYLNTILPAFASTFRRKWSKSRPLNELLAAVSSPLGVSFDDAFALFGRSIWLRQLPIDLHSQLLHHEEPVKLIQ